MTRYRLYDQEADRAAVRRILREVGWLEAGKEEPWDVVFGCGPVSVAEVNGEPESVVSAVRGTMLYLEQELPFTEFNAVAASRVARQRGLTKGLVAHALAGAVAEGAILARVCVFDQGYYNHVGFGTGVYEHKLTFDPLTLNIDREARVPRRLGVNDADLIHASRLARWRGHGGVNYPAVGLTASCLMFAAEKGFGLGYCDGPNGELTHHFWCEPDQVDHGPYPIQWMAYQTGEQFLELMAIIKGLGDQVQMVRMGEPAGIQLQDFLRRPFRQHRATEQSKYENRNAAYAYWQVRVCDLPQCLAATHLDCREVRFNLQVSDPIERLLEASAPWRGVAGEYVVILGPESSAKPGADAELPTLTASVNAFSRMWLGAQPATGLAVTDDLEGPAALLAALDRALRLPEPKPDWDF